MDRDIIIEFMNEHQIDSLKYSIKDDHHEFIRKGEEIYDHKDLKNCEVCEKLFLDDEIRSINNYCLSIFHNNGYTLVCNDCSISYNEDACCSCCPDCCVFCLNSK